MIKVIKVNINFLLKRSFPEVDGVARLEVDLLLGEDLEVLLLLHLLPDEGSVAVAAPELDVPSEATAGPSGSVTNLLGDSSADLEIITFLALHFMYLQLSGDLSRLCSHWSSSYITALSLVELLHYCALIGREVHSVVSPALLCHKEPAPKSPLLGDRASVDIKWN